MENAPSLPPASSFIMPNTAYAEMDSTGMTADPDSRYTPTFGNWWHAGTSVLVYNTALVLTMAIPVTSFAEAFNHAPKHVGQGVYVWEYSFNDGNKVYTAELSGQYINAGEDVQWDMRISLAGAFSDVLWYSGVIATDARKGSWILNHQPFNPEAALAIDYEVNAAGTESKIRYTNIISGHIDNGDYIEYGIINDTDLNRMYNVFRGDGDLLQIEWNEPSHNGRVKHALHFGDDAWYCWDDAAIDIEC